MIDSVDFLLKDWVQKLLPDAEVQFAAPEAGETDSNRAVVHIHLLQIVPGLPVARSSGAVSELILSYLLTVNAGEPMASHRLLGELAFAALESTDFELDAQPPGPDVWLALGTPPQPALLLRVPLRRERPQPAAALVRVPLVLQTAGIIALNGVVVGPEDVPLTGAHVDLPALRLTRTTGSRGEFAFPAVPAGEQLGLRVRARGREMRTVVDSVLRDEPVVIRFNPLEEEG